MGLFGRAVAREVAREQTEAILAAIRKELKKGRSTSQCKCIDYLYTVDEPASKGCGGKKKKKKKKGCFSAGSWDMDDYIAYVEKHMNDLNLKQRAIEKIGLDESQISEIPPVALCSFQLKGDGVITKSEETEIENLWRHVSNKYSVTWIFFSATQIYTHTYIFDSITDHVFEMTRDFFYKDITCIRTEHEVFETRMSRQKGCFFWKKQYYYRLTEYDTMSITVPNDSYCFWCQTNDTIEQSIQAAKAMIREKKNG